jgi:2-C-methyl-D-erythritol 4-phosphate cytidylyltransferase
VPFDVAENGGRQATWGIVVAAGSGTRFGATKQYELLAGRTVLERSIEITRRVCRAVVAVLPPDDVDRRAGVADVVVGGGATRSASVRNGLAAVPLDSDLIIVHDAVRPIAAAELFDGVIAAIEAGADAAVCAVAVTDTIRRVDGGTIDRTGLVAVQTPQAFRAAALREAHADGGEATDDATLVERIGGRIVIVPGASENIKITHPHDLLMASALIVRGM